MSLAQRSKVGKVGLKLVSLALALLLEFYFYSQDNSVTQLISAVIEVQNVPDDRLIVEPVDAEKGIPAHFEVRGPRSVVQQIASNIHVVSLPFPEGKPSTASVDVPYESLGFPPSVRIESARPARLSLKTVEVIRKAVPISVTIKGSPKKGFSVVEKSIFPRSVIVKGPMNEIKNIRNVVVEPVDIDGLSSSQKLELRLQSPGEFSRLSVSLVSVDIIIKEDSTSDESNSEEKE